ncbi:hypothetical protein DRN98_09615 [Methanosarcinales archaeon]|nr:MAG: hypothetical protein DRN98_09615 [Methanosarcinales archaeon]
MQIVCAWCKKVMGIKQGTGTVYVMCPECLAKLQQQIVTLRRHLIGAERVTEKILKKGGK